MYIRTEQPQRAIRSSLGFLSSVPSNDCNIVLPKGKGMIIVSLRSLTASDVVKRVRDSGLSWLAIERATQIGGRHENKNTIESIKKHVDTLRTEVDKDFGIWVYGGHPNPLLFPTLISSLVDTAVAVAAEGVILNPEKPWKTKKGRTEAKIMMESLIKEAHAKCLSVGITSYPIPDDAGKGMAWDEFSKADFGLPQIYSSAEGLKYPERAVEAWKKKGFRIIIPLLSSVPRKNGRFGTPDPKTMQEMFDVTPIPDCAIAWWVWHLTNPKRWDVIGDAKVPLRCKLRGLWEYFLNVKPQIDGLGLAGAGQSYVRVPITDKPTPCRFYTIKSGVDSRGLIDLAGRAYGVGTNRTKLAQWINNHPYNRRFWRANLATKDFPQGRISFNPRFASNIDRQADATGMAPSGGAFATIFIPPPPDWLDKAFSTCNVEAIR